MVNKIGWWLRAAGAALSRVYRRSGLAFQKVNGGYLDGFGI